MENIEPKHMKRPFFENLDALRFFAFLVVFFSHCVYDFNYVFPYKILELIHLHFFRNGELGVNFFFVLSGFLISWLLFVEKENNNNEINIKAFYVRRILRIWPVYFVVVIIGFSAAFFINLGFLNNPNFDQNMHIKQLPWYLFLLANFDVVKNGNGSLTLSVLWSVAVEEQFYLFWPLFFSFFTKKRLLYFCYFIIVISFIYRCAFQSVYAKFSTLAVMSELAMGALACYYSITNKAFLQFIKSLSSRNIIIMYVMFFLYIPLHGFSHIFGPRIFSIYYPFESIIFSIFFAFIILEQNFSDHSFFKFGKLKLASKWGKISYGLYAYHAITIPVAYFFINYLLGIKDSIFASYLLKIIIAFSLSILIGKISFKYLETPFLRLKKRFEKI